MHTAGSSPDMSVIDLYGAGEDASGLAVFACEDLGRRPT